MENTSPLVVNSLPETTEKMSPQVRRKRGRPRRNNTNHQLVPESEVKYQDNGMDTRTKIDKSDKLLKNVKSKQSNSLQNYKACRSKTCLMCGKDYLTSAELNSHITQAHQNQVNCPECNRQFPTPLKVMKHLQEDHDVTRQMISCQSCNKRFKKTHSLQLHISKTHQNDCTVCKETFIDKQELMSHRLEHHPETELTCDICNHKCLSKVDMHKHMNQVHKQFKCDLCEKQFKSGSTLYHHKRAIHGKCKPYQCKLCDLSFNFNHSMKLHMIRHQGQRPHKCSICSKAYLTATHLKHHVLAVHEEAKPFKCSKCNKTFPYENSLRLHLRLHTGERPFTCSVCAKSFISRSALRVHEELHNENLGTACEVCHKTYKTPSLLRAHRRRHTADGERFICDICGNRFMYRSNLETHYSVHSESRPHKCKSCGKCFKTYAALYSHLPVHQDTCPFVCTKCGKSFKTKERLKAHEQRHGGQKPFVCNLCNRAFPDKGGLTKHAKTVHATKPRYACPVCDKTCNRADNLRVHMKVHGNSDLLKLSINELAVVEPGQEITQETVTLKIHTNIGLQNAGGNGCDEGNNVVSSKQFLPLTAVAHEDPLQKQETVVTNPSNGNSYPHDLLDVYTHSFISNQNFGNSMYSIASQKASTCQQNFPAAADLDFQKELADCNINQTI